MERKYRIYRYTNILNGMMYHGKTCKKWQCARSGHNGSQYIQNSPMFGKAILEFGWPNFKYEVLEDGLTEEEADIRERYWIEKENSIWPNGYNLEGGGKHNSVHPKTKEKMSKSHKGEKNWNYGSHHTEETKKKMADSHTHRKVFKYTKDGKLVDEYCSISEASKKSKVNPGGICECCQGKRKLAGNYFWSYTPLDKNI